MTVQKEQKGDTLIHTAVDGKIMRGTLKQGREDQPPVHLLSFYECESGIVLDQFLVDKKRNEESACQAIFHPLLVKGRIISGDSMFRCRDWCATVYAYDGYYLLPVKKNNSAVFKYIQQFFDDKEIDQKEFQYHKEVKKEHGRLETREIWANTQMNEFFEEEWAAIAQIFKIQRKRQKKGGEAEEIAYGITSVPREYANAERLLDLNRKHWHSENRLHYRRDVTLGEDASQVRSHGAHSA